MRLMFTALWTMLTTFLEGLAAYGSAFKKTGEIAESTVDSYAEQLEMERQDRREEFMDKRAKRLQAAGVSVQ